MSEAIAAGLPDPSAYLLPEEEIRLVVRRHHPIVLSGAAAIVLGVVVVGVGLLILAGPSTPLVVVVLIALAAAVLHFMAKWVRWSRTVLVITNRRLFSFRSLGIKKVSVLPVLRQSIVFRQNPIGRWLGFGTIEVRTANGSTLYNFDWLGDVERFHEEITNLAS
jgi:hypothetical protein